MIPEEKKNHFDPGNFPTLLEFLPAYLHEDFGEEYGTAAQAIEALLADISGDEIRNVKDEWRALRQTFVGQPFDGMQKALAELGTTWLPQSEQELQSVDEILNRPEGSHPLR